MIKGSHHTEEMKKRISEAEKGKLSWNKGLTKETDERIRKSSEKTKGRIAWNKGLKGKQTAWNKGLTKETDERVKQYGEKQQGKHLPEEQIKKLSEINKGNTYRLGSTLTDETKRKIGKGNTGKKHSKEWKKKRSESQIGEKCYNWQGGITPFHQSIRTNYIYRQWRDDIFTRDNFTCNICGGRGCYLHAHHIKSFSSIMRYYEITTLEEALECSELWNINNGITLCKECHKKIHKKVINNVNDKNPNG